MVAEEIVVEEVDEAVDEEEEDLRKGVGHDFFGKRMKHNGTLVGTITRRAKWIIPSIDL